MCSLSSSLSQPDREKTSLVPQALSPSLSMLDTHKSKTWERETQDEATRKQQQQQQQQKA